MNVESWVKEKDCIPPSTERHIVSFGYKRVHVNVEPQDTSLYPRKL